MGQLEAVSQCDCWLLEELDQHLSRHLDQRCGPVKEIYWRTQNKYKGSAAKVHFYVTPNIVHFPNETAYNFNGTLWAKKMNDNLYMAFVSAFLKETHV